MMKITRWFVMAALCSGAAPLLAQDNAAPQPQGGGRQGRGGPPDAAQIQQWQQQRMERYKEQLEIKDDGEWKVIEPMVTKVTEAQRAAFADRMRGAFGGGRGGRGGGPGGNRGGFGGEPSPEADALQKAIDGQAPNSEMKAALARYLEARKAKQAELEKAQAELRKVLSVRQEALATMAGLL
jgi:hypothetical protein